MDEKFGQKVIAVASLIEGKDVYNRSLAECFVNGDSLSKFLATGFSILNNVSYYDEPFLLWRSSSQWLGGLLFLLAVIGTLGSKQSKIKPAYLISPKKIIKMMINNIQ